MNKKQFDEWEKATTNFDFDEKLIRMQMKRSKIKHVSIRFLLEKAQVLYLISDKTQQAKSYSSLIP